METLTDLLLTTRVFLLSTFFTFLIVLVVKYWKHNKRYYDLAAKFQEPVGYSRYPLIGHGHHMGPKSLINLAKSYTASYGVLYLGMRVCYFLNDPKLLENLLTNDKCLDKPYYMDYFKYGQGGLFLAKGAAWRTRRKLLNPAFKQNLLNYYASTFHTHDSNMMRQLYAKGGNVFDINDLSTRCNFDKFFECALGLTGGIYGNDYFEALDKVTRGALERIMCIYHNIDFIYKFKKSWKLLEESIQVMRKISVDVLNRRRALRKAEGLHETIAELDESKQLIFLDYLLDCAESDEKFTDNDIVNEITTFIVAGIETCAVTFSFLCLALALHSEIQQKVYKEICEVIGDKQFHHTDYPRFRYLQTVIKETLRMFPVGPITIRVPSDDVTIGAYTYPEGSFIHCNIINVHYSEKYYKHPLKFDPDRFDPESEECRSRHKYAYIPFMAGKRNCIGERFGNLSLIATAATVFKRFRFETTYQSIEDIALEQNLTLHAMDGFHVKVFPREQ